MNKIFTLALAAIIFRLVCPGAANAVGFLESEDLPETYFDFSEVQAEPLASQSDSSDETGDASSKKAAGGSLLEGIFYKRPAFLISYNLSYPDLVRLMSTNTIIGPKVRARILATRIPEVSQTSQVPLTDYEFRSYVFQHRNDEKIDLSRFEFRPELVRELPRNLLRKLTQYVMPLNRTNPFVSNQFRSFDSFYLIVDPKGTVAPFILSRPALHPEEDDFNFTDAHATCRVRDGRLPSVAEFKALKRAQTSIDPVSGQKRYLPVSAFNSISAWSSLLPSDVSGKVWVFYGDDGTVGHADGEGDGWDSLCVYTPDDYYGAPVKEGVFKLSKGHSQLEGLNPLNDNKVYLIHDPSWKIHPFIFEASIKQGTHEEALTQCKATGGSLPNMNQSLLVGEVFGLHFPGEDIGNQYFWTGTIPHEMPNYAFTYPNFINELHGADSFFLKKRNKINSYFCVYPAKW